MNVNRIRSVEPRPGLRRPWRGRVVRAARYLSAVAAPPPPMQGVATTPNETSRRLAQVRACDY